MTETGGRPPLLLTNLLNDLAALGALLVERIAAADLLNAFLLAAGMQQVACDHLHRDPCSLDRAADRVRRRLPGVWGRLASRVVRAAGSLLWWARIRTGGHRASETWLADLEGLVERLAGALVDQAAWETPCPRPHLGLEAAALVARLQRLPAPLRRALVRLPGCFRSFDQAPEDLEALAGAFVRHWPERRPLLVVGIRSSGSYLAPLLAAMLRRHGLQVSTATLRPGQRWLHRERLPLIRAAVAGGRALLTDDPPRSWASVSRATQTLAGLGFDRRRVVLLLATFTDAVQPPAALEDHPAVLLPFGSWAVRRRLEPEAVHDSLARLLTPQAVLEVRPAGALPGGVGRGHAEAVYEVALAAAGGPERQLVRARGVGLGYFGEHALAVAGRLRGRVTGVHGLERGVLYEAWRPPATRLAGPLASRQAAAVAGYVVERGRALRLPRDPSRPLSHRGAAWQWAGQALGGLFGRGSELGRPLSAALVRRLLTVAQPGVIDNRTALDAFALAPDQETVVKADFDSGVFTNEDFCCFDPVADVALAAVAAGDAATGEQLRRAYERAAGRPVDPERWLLYQLVHVLVSQQQLRPEARHVDLRPSRLLQRYYGEVLLGGLEPAATGPLCAIDLDGVLETTPLGFPATSPAGALALRALLRHGFRPLLATGRSLEEVRDRCAAYGLAGGVAEYGAVLVRDGDRVRSLVEAADLEALELLRASLAASGEVCCDPAYRYSVRAFRLDGRGRRRGLDAGHVARALAAPGVAGRVRAVQGHHQTDFVPAGVSKERALRLLARELGVEGEPPLVLAVGDAAPDLGMLRLARLGIAPGNADAAIRDAAGVTVVRPRAQAGLAEAVARLLGHRPGACATCARPALPEASRFLLDLLAVQDVRPWRQAVRGLRLLAVRIPK